MHAGVVNKCYCDARRCRWISDRYDQVLLVIGIEVDTVPAANAGFAVAENVPRETNSRRKIFARRVFIKLGQLSERDRSSEGKAESRP